MKFKVGNLFAWMLSLLMIVTGSHVVSAHGDDAGEPPVLMESAEPVCLEDWEGEFYSMTSIFNQEDLEDEVLKIADAHGETLDELLEDVMSEHGCSFDGLKFEDDTISFFGTSEIEDAEPLFTVKYKFKDTYQGMFGNFTYEWYVFEAEELPEFEVNDDQNSKEADEIADKAVNLDFQRLVPENFKYIALMELHGEEVLQHFHLRYSNEVDNLWEHGGWWPTFVSASTPVDRIVEGFIEEAEHEHEHEHKDAQEEAKNN